MYSIKQIERERFPSLLAEINDPPSKLYVAGDLPVDQSKFLCVVGSRKYSDYGKNVCRTLIEGLRGYPIVIVSGLALGIDAIAHKAALDSGLTTIAVPGSGLDRNVIYPASHANLAENIVHAGGALVSEFEPNFRATQWSFPARNRIMAGLSHAVLVIEASVKSGTLITARLAMDYNRDVFAVPGSVYSATSDGPHNLLKNGARLITSPSDLLDAMEFKNNDERKVELLLNDDEKVVWEFLGEPKSRDALEEIGWTATRLNICLTTLELKGLIRESFGQVHRLS